MFLKAMLRFPLHSAGAKRKWFEEKQKRKAEELERLGLDPTQVCLSEGSNGGIKGVPGWRRSVALGPWWTCGIVCAASDNTGFGSETLEQTEYIYTYV